MKENLSKISGGIYEITEYCTNCGACAGECVFNAIKKVNDSYVIDQDECVHCGVCVGACSADAIIEH